MPAQRAWGVARDGAREWTSRPDPRVASARLAAYKPRAREHGMPLLPSRRSVSSGESLPPWPALASRTYCTNHSRMAHARAALVDRPVDPVTLIAEVSDRSRGAICSFVGTVRDQHDGRAVTGLQYDCYESMATRELESIVAEAGERFGGPAIAVEHRVGTLAVGEIAVAIAAAHARRGSAIGAMQYVIEELKKRLPIWKLEHYADGTRAWVKGSEAAAQPAEGAEAAA